ncbi:electron transport complex subunit RsxC [Chloroflexota bacterium]
MALIIYRNGKSNAIHLPDYGLTAGSPIETLPLPPNVILPLFQQDGGQCNAIVKKGDIVLSGQKIADGEEFAATPVHASISGEITGIIKIIYPTTGRPVDAIVITSDGEDKCVEHNAAGKPESLSAKDMLDRIREAGISGNEADNMTAHVRLSPPQGKKIDAVIINGSQCEPYLAADTQLMQQKLDEVLSGANIINRILSPAVIYITIDAERRDILDNILNIIKTSGLDNYKIVLLENNYPATIESNLVNVILGREIAPGATAAGIGVAVFNAKTALAINDAIFCGKPFTDKVISVAGGVNKPGNLRIRFGTPLKYVIDYCGGIKGDADKIVINGLMSGTSVYNDDFPVTKEVNSILLEKNVTSKEGDCIRCGKCLEICPARLAPTLLAAYAKAGRYDECEEAYIGSCIECGACAYICPSNIPLLQYIKVAKSELAKKAAIK